MMNLILVTALGLLPVYVFGSGGFQLVDIPIMILAGIAISSKFDKDKYLKTIFWLLPFIFWGSLVDSGYWVVSTDIYYLRAGITLAYDFVMLFVFSIIFTKILDNNNIKYIYLGLILSIILCLFVRGVPEGEGVERQVLSFNDPNQLGYYSAILVAYVILLLRFKEVNRSNKPIYYLFDIIIISFAHIFLSLSVSRSAIGAFLVLDICLLKNIKNLRILLPVFACGAMAFVFLMYINPHFLEERMAVRGPGAFSEEGLKGGLAERALSPLDYLEGIKIFIGVGSGGGGGAKRSIAEVEAMRAMKAYGGESHNIFFDALRSYGLIGICLLAFFFLKAMLTTWKTNDALFVWVGLLTYNMGNNGVRFRPFWIVLALLFALARCRDKKNLPA